MHYRSIIFILIFLFLGAGQAAAGFRYEVTITNITKGQTFTPQLVAGHARSVRVFSLGDTASAELEILAESGDTVPLSDELAGLGREVGEVTTIPGLLEPGESATVEIRVRGHQRFLSIAAMLIPTNDTFVALNGVRLPRSGTKTYTALAYDAGTEFNDQNCANIPGPRCGGAASSASAENDEGFIYVSNGFHDIGVINDRENEILGPFVYDWRNPVARVVVRRIR